MATEDHQEEELKAAAANNDNGGLLDDGCCEEAADCELPPSHKPAAAGSQAPSFGSLLGKRSHSKQTLTVLSAKRQYQKAEVKSIVSNSVASSVSESRNSKFIIGSKLGNRATVKEVKEEEWKLIRKEGKYSFYCCLLCQSQKEVRKDNRRTHVCH